MNDLFMNIFSSVAAEDVAVFFTELFSYLSKVVLVILAVIIVVRCAKSLLKFRSDDEVWGYFRFGNGERIDIKHWESLIGRAASCDIQINFPTISRQHAAFIRNAKGNWRIYNLNSKNGILVNDEEIGLSCKITNGDVIDIGGVKLSFNEVSNEEAAYRINNRQKPGRIIRPGSTLAILALFQIMICISACLNSPENVSSILFGFIGLIAIMWLCYIVTRIFRRTGFEVETMALFLTTIGFAVCASSSPESMKKQVILLFVGVILYFILCGVLSNLEAAKKLRIPAGIFGLGFLAFNLVFGSRVFGATNWVYIGGFSIQPSEFVKIAFIFCGSATLDKTFSKRYLIMFVAFAAACVGALALMGDFGTAIIFFVTYIVITILRSGDIPMVVMSVAGAAFAAVIAVRFKPYIASRFATWGHAWMDASNGGYQQTRTMSAAASGGLFGQGVTNGWLKNIIAADTDLVFGVVCEELGLLIALCAVAVIIVYTVFVFKSSGHARSCFYITAACAVCGLLTFQMMLNIFGAVDILPLTGVTFPFVSKGGSSLLSCWCLLAFIKSADTRQNASLAQTLQLNKKEYKSGIKEIEEEQAEYENMNVDYPAGESSDYYDSPDYSDYDDEDWGEEE